VFGSHLHNMTMKSRHRDLTSAMVEVAGSANRKQVGSIRKVLVEEEGIARSEWDAADIDGRVFVPTDLTVGEFAEVRITDHRGYDLIATTA
ncbi:MAG: TRAM domain-containing protein, partial [Verrucomicrobiota bacterium]|nr:TRAM domain-containing protein [Verrucomicrobiota bacterium]